MDRFFGIFRLQEKQLSHHKAAEILRHLQNSSTLIQVGTELRENYHYAYE